MNLRHITIFLILLGVYSCDFKKDESIEETIITESEASQNEEDLKVEKSADYFALNEWENYYSNKMVDFDLNNFSKQETFELKANASETVPVWKPEFNPVYAKFLRYNKDSTQYIDFMSYKLQFDDNNEIILAPDQEVLLVDVKNKQVKQLLFYGPSYWIEDAYFKNDSTVVLLENSNENKPAYQEINLNTLKSDYYTYNKTVEFSSDYLKEKILKEYQINP